MAGHKESVKPAKCSGKRKDGSPCNSYAREDGLCGWHLSKRDEPEAVALEPVVLLPPDSEPEASGEQATGDGTPGGIREAFKDAARASVPEMITALKEVAGMTKPHKVRCPQPNCRYEFSVPVPDGNARVKAIDTLMDLGYGPTPKDESAKTETVDLGIDPFTLDADELRAHREAIARAYPEAAAQFKARSAAEREQDRTKPRATMGIPKKRRAGESH